MKGGFMQIHIARHSRHMVLSAVVASTVALIAATGGFKTLARAGDAALEFYTQVVSDWGQHITDTLDPTRPHCF
jgi:hypothetical protein